MSIRSPLFKSAFTILYNIILFAKIKKRKKKRPNRSLLRNSKHIIQSKPEANIPKLAC